MVQNSGEAVVAQATSVAGTINTLCELIVQTKDAGGIVDLLKYAWVYWRMEGKLTLLRTDGAGRCFFAAQPDARRTDPWEYTERFKTKAGVQVELYFSRGAKPIPEQHLNTHTQVFSTQKVPPPPSGTPLTAKITLPNTLIQMTKPAELTLWPLLWDLCADNYYTEGINQDVALWANPAAQGSLTVTENSPAPIARPAVRPKERGLKVEGVIDSYATGVTLQVINENNTIIMLRRDFTTPGNIQEVHGTLGAPSGNKKPFEAVLIFADAVRSFGPLQIVVASEGMTPPIMEAFAVHFCGFQIALVDDHMENQNGQQRGPIQGVGDEKTIVDFIDSPQQQMNDLSQKTRARRMVAYDIVNHRRPLDPNAPQGANNPAVLQPQMPMWMVELQIVGCTRQQLENLMARRYFRQYSGLINPYTPIKLRFDLQWQLTLSWDGPDINSPSFPTITRHQQVYRYSQIFPSSQETQVVELFFGSRGQFTDASAKDIALGNESDVPNAFSLAPSAISFPVAGRRLPKVIVSGQTRYWRLQNSENQKETLLIEFQPRIVSQNNEEIIRGGDGVLELQRVSVDGQHIDGGMVPGTGNVVSPPPSTDPDFRLPRFRVRGTNPMPHADVQNTINALVQEFFASHNNLNHVVLLPLACWQETARRIFAHENGGDCHFDVRPSNRRRDSYVGFYYGHERDMPLFGPPHGYGFGQLDYPPVDDDSAWNFFSNIRRAVLQIFQIYGLGAYQHFTQGNGAATFNALANTDPQRRRALYQRELVRRYNGGTEFRWNAQATDWQISPSLARWEDPNNHNKGPNPRLPYPNRVLGTNVHYFEPYPNGTGANTQFPWPITFTPAMYGPST